MSPAKKSTLSFSQTELTDLVQQVLGYAQKGGATSCDVDVSEGVGQNVSVRLGEVETIEYNRDKGVGVTVYIGQCKGHASSSDFSPAALEQTVAAALAIARYTAADSAAGLADPDRLATLFPDLDLYHPWDLPVEQAIELAQRCESAARDVDARISNSEGATVSSHVGQSVYGNSNGFIGPSQTSRHSISCTVIAQEGDAMQRDYWYSSARAPTDLDAADAVGLKAGQRTLARLGTRRLKTGDYRVLFDPSQAAGLMGHFISAVSGSALYRKASFLVDSIGKPVFAPLVNIVEDPFLLRGMASSVFDGEGVACVRRDLVKDGVLGGYLLGSYSARKLGLASTGNAGGCHNLLVSPTAGDFQDMLQRLDTGFLVTELLGQGVNGITGDYSRGAAGFWVEKGVIVHPVEEVTIAGNLKDMFHHIVAIGSDIEVRGSKRVGSVLIERMMVAGE
ncbi:metalloprotease PmbA [Chitinimonas sp. BJB300]|uniref:metalloprotease PmbA n=1 Tax=Chitinimonas sp. BJB300 TaxID=1559339 RepID=UPI000C0EB809|nr:metalloprotease PmbA [Chitinimonas sp. BJB300]PHV10095.1 metalloprotease PmbA [Chitinimonas sp. BJB300]TSJ87344.1 metalloprotease PmbA [Chitinimonas sp. BJB300]